MTDGQIMRSLAIAVVFLAVVVGVNRCQPAFAASEFTAEHTLDAIGQASADTGVPYSRIYRIVRCETAGTFSPYIEGDRGHSHGAAQLNDYGNALPKFYEVGYTDPYNPYEAIYFMAETLRGDHPPLGRWTWNC